LLLLVRRCCLTSNSSPPYQASTRSWRPDVERRLLGLVLPPLLPLPVMLPRAQQSGGAATAADFTTGRGVLTSQLISGSVDGSVAYGLFRNSTCTSRHGSSRRDL
jgi:hypothetical protein